MAEIHIIASKGKSFSSGLIRARQWGYPYTHIAYVGTTYPENQNDPKVIEAWWGGVREGPMSEVHTPGTPFSLFCIQCNEEQAAGVDAFIREQIGVGYDYRGLLGFVTFSKRVENKDKWFCSELVFEALLRNKFYPLRDTYPAEVSPYLFLKIPHLSFMGDFTLPGK